MADPAGSSSSPDRCPAATRIARQATGPEMRDGASHINEQFYLLDMGAKKKIEQDVLTRLFLDHGDGLLAFFVRRTFDGQVALDLVSETFAQAIASRAKFRGTTDEEAVGWLYAIGRHQLIAYQRKGKIQMRAMRRLGVPRQEIDDAELEAIEEAAGLDTLQTAINYGMAQLSAEHRHALQLRVVDELPYQQVAERLGISEQTARARVSRALRRLESLLHSTDLTPGEAS